MAEISAYEAKTHLSRLLARAEKGERIVITKHGRAVAQLVPMEAEGRMSRDEAIRRLRAFRDKHPLGGITVRELIDEGRKW
ncbi:MAG: type II toxin-antitoxin system prevent-host-death family antitoxin [Alphaproteobacteria bacterium]|nr:type II toxin-antitoxin system prevent-host-death family antitoxin [Alphaproteobacteria bacterium]